MNWQDRIYENLVEDLEITEGERIKKALQVGALALGAAGVHNVTKQRPLQPTQAQHQSGENPGTSSKIGRAAAKHLGLKKDRRSPAEWNAKAENWKNNPNNPDYQPKNPGEAKSIEAHKKSADERFRKERERKARERGGN